MNTKEKIMVTSIKVFNEKGYDAVNLKELASIIGISRGNLTYHFKNKEELLVAIVEEMWAKIDHTKQKTRQIPSFENLHNQTQLYYQFQQAYSFIFLDANVSNHPSVKPQFQTMIEQALEDFRQIIAFGIQLGNLKEESIPGTYHSLAFSIWMVSFYWLSQQTTRGELAEANAEKTLWGLILPYLTEKGIAAFKSFFGEQFYQEIGKPFEVNQYAIIRF